MDFSNSISDSRESTIIRQRRVQSSSLGGSSTCLTAISMPVLAFIPRNTLPNEPAPIKAPLCQRMRGWVQISVVSLHSTCVVGCSKTVESDVESNEGECIDSRRSRSSVISSTVTIAFAMSFMSSSGLQAGYNLDTGCNRIGGEGLRLSYPGESV